MHGDDDVRGVGTEGIVGAHTKHVRKCKKSALFSFSLRADDQQTVHPVNAHYIPGDMPLECMYLKFTYLTGCTYSRCTCRLSGFFNASVHRNNSAGKLVIQVDQGGRERD